jgi:hypothetical protein
VYTSDLTSLFTWTCPRCKDHTKVTRLRVDNVRSSSICTRCSMCSLAPNCLFLLSLLTQGFEVIEVIVDVANCLQVSYYFTVSGLLILALLDESLC